MKSVLKRFQIGVVGVLLAVGLVSSAAGDYVYFADEFDGTSIDPARWDEDLAGGVISVSSGEAAFSQPNPSTTFPRLSRAGAFPTTGDFVLEVRMKYGPAQPNGTGFFVQGENPTSVIDKGVFQIWKDSNIGLTVVNRNGDSDLFNDPWVQNFGDPEAYHTYRWEYTGGSYILYIDGSQIGGPITSGRPDRIWIGNFLNGSSSVGWTGFVVDYVRVTAIADNTPPDASTAAPSITSIWPPNNKMVPITINGVTDPDGDAVTITINGITNNETGTADAGGIGTSTAQVRATRNGKGNGRTYTITFTADDGKGGSTNGSVTVVVPHDQGGELADDDHGDDDHGDDDHGDQGKVEKKNDGKNKKDEDKGEKKDDDKNKKTAAKAPGKRGKPVAVENATWGEIKNAEF